MKKFPKHTMKSAVLAGGAAGVVHRAAASKNDAKTKAKRMDVFARIYSNDAFTVDAAFAAFGHLGAKK